MMSLICLFPRRPLTDRSPFPITLPPLFIPPLTFLFLLSLDKKIFLELRIIRDISTICHRNEEERRNGAVINPWKLRARNIIGGTNVLYLSGRAN